MIELNFSFFPPRWRYGQGWIIWRNYSPCLLINSHDIWALLNTKEGQEKWRWRWRASQAISAKSWNQNLKSSTPLCQGSRCFIYVGHLPVRSYFSHAETIFIWFKSIYMLISAQRGRITWQTLSYQAMLFTTDKLIQIILIICKKKVSYWTRHISPAHVDDPD